MTLRRWFHVLLGAILVPLLSLPVVWGVALHGLRRAGDVEARRWARRILALALVDTLVVAAAAIVLATAEPGALEAPPSAPEDRVVLGVGPDHAFDGAGARIARVLPGSPAAAAGLEVGDVIVRVGGEEISGAEALRSAVGELEPGVPASVDVQRGSSTLAVAVTPRRASEIPRPPPGAAEPTLGAAPCFPRPSLPGLIELAAVLAVTAVLAALVAWRGSVRGAARGVGWTGLAVVAAALAGYAVPAGACVLLGGRGTAGAILAPLGSSVALAAAALAGRRLAGEPAGPAPTRSWGSAAALGGWYMITGGLRIVVVLAAVLALAPGQEAGSHPVESLLRGLDAPALPHGLLLVGIAGVVVAPVGEELAFRGLLQPALGAWLGPAGAVALTSVLFSSLHWYYGPKLALLVFIAAVLGWARVASGGVRAPIVLHMLMNAVAFGSIVAQAPGG